MIFVTRNKATSTRLRPTDPGLRVYPYFLSFFQERNTITPDDLVIGASFSYSWMPTMLQVQGSDEDWVAAAGILNSSREMRITSKESLGLLARVINNSLVGTSKLLHFVSPERHAIWDSRVYSYLTGKLPHGYRMSNTANYLRFLEICDEITSWSEFPEVARRFQERLGQQCTPLRVVELTMWANGNPEK